MSVYTNGNDTPSAPDIERTVYMLDGNDVVIGNRPTVQTISGGSGDDVLTYIGASVGLLYGDDGFDTLTGGASNDHLYGGYDDDILVGLDGVDVIEGGDGNDDCYGGLDRDPIFGGGGSDELFGEGGDDDLYGGWGNDALRGGSGADRMSGDDGDDGYDVTEAGDRVLEHANEGSDTAFIAIDYTLSANVEHLRMFPDVPVDGTGNALANGMTGNGTANTLSGMAGNDVLSGGGGNDTLTGGAGRDTLFGELGADKFDFNSKSESVKGGNRDIIQDFNRGQGDRIDLATIDADTSSNSGNDAFKFISKDAFEGGGRELRYIDNGSTCTVQGDINGDKVADFEIKVNIGSLNSGDFFL